MQGAGSWQRLRQRYGYWRSQINKNEGKDKDPDEEGLELIKVTGQLPIISMYEGTKGQSQYNQSFCNRRKTE